MSKPHHLRLEDREMYEAVRATGACLGTRFGEGARVAAEGTG